MKKISLLLVMLAAILSGCESINNKEVPSFMVRIDLGTYAVWNTYGVAGVGDFRYFNRVKQLPSNFPYNVNTYTGFGGVLLLMGMDPATGNYAPIAFDAACPVENRMDVVVGINSENFEAVCPKCGSRYDVLMGSGGPLSGPAITHKYGLRMLKVRTTGNGGYIITNS